MQLFGSDIIFFVIACTLSDNCKQSITVLFFTINVLLTLFESLVAATIGLQRQTSHADAVTGLLVPLPGLLQNG